MVPNHCSFQWEPSIKFWLNDPRLPEDFAVQFHFLPTGHHGAPINFQFSFQAHYLGEHGIPTKCQQCCWLHLTMVDSLHHLKIRSCTKRERKISGGYCDSIAMVAEIVIGAHQGIKCLYSLYRLHSNSKNWMWHGILFYHRINWNYFWSTKHNIWPIYILCRLSVVIHVQYTKRTKPSSLDSMDTQKISAKVVVALL